MVILFIKPRLVLTLLIALAAITTSLAQQSISGIPFIRTFRTTDYKAGLQNWDITQDDRGFLYVANNFGLLEFDGTGWRTFGVSSGTKVRSVAIDGRGRIYAGAQGDFGYFFPDAKGRLAYTSLADRLDPSVRNFDETWNVYVDGNITYFCTFSGIYRFESGRFSSIGSGSPIGRSFLVSRKLHVTHTAGVSVLNGQTLEPLPGTTAFERNDISSILPAGNDGLLIATYRRGIFRYAAGVLTPWNESRQQLFSEASINGLIRLRDGRYAAGTQNNGLYILNAQGEPLMNLTQGRGLENRTILSLHEDDRGNLWLGQNNIITMVELGSPFTFINETIGLPGTGYAAHSEGDVLYLATNNGVYTSTADGKFVLVANSSGQAYHIGRYGTSLMLGHHNGAHVLTGATATPISAEAGSWTFLPLHNGQKLLEGTYSGLQVYRNMDGRWSLMKKLEGFSESARLMAWGPDGELWVTHGYKGAYRIRLNATADSILSVKHYGAETGLPSNRLINVFRVGGRDLFTSESGVFRYDPLQDAFLPDELFTRKLGPHAQVWYVQEDPAGNIYFIARESIGVLKINAIGGHDLETGSFARIRPFLNDDLHNITILNDQTVLFGAKEGFIRYAPSTGVSSVTTPKTWIRHVSGTVENDPVFFDGTHANGDSVIRRQLKTHQPDLPYENNAITFSFSTPDHRGNEETVYQHYLHPYEQTWSAWSPRTSREYTNLREGNYTFHVRSRNISGEVSSAATYVFTVLPPWYRTYWSYIAGFMLIAGLFFGNYRLISRKFRRQQEILRERQDTELKSKENELSRLSLQSKEEINRLQNEKLESELQHMNNELATATVHLLNKNEFIAHIKGHLHQILKNPESGTLKPELEQITKEIDQNFTADADWQQFQFHFDRVHGDFSNRFRSVHPSLSPQEMKLTAYLRMNLSSKEIAQLLNISVRGVEISRYRLRKKLGIDRQINLQAYILNF